MQGNPDAAHDSVRLILEQSIGRLVGAFEHYTEALFATLPAAATAKVKRGSFQRLADASSLWHSAVGKGYQDMLTAHEMASLVRLVQQRHLLTHTNGIVDADYLTKSADTTYSIGQRVLMRESDVLTLADIVGKLADALKFLASPDQTQ